MSSSAPVPALDIAGATEPQFIPINGIDTAYRRAGTGTPLVFLHGMGQSNSWLEHHRLFAESFDLIAPQHPGFGRTVRPAWYRSLDDLVPHYLDFFDALQLEKVHLVGHSLGGILAAAFASIYPERLLSLTLVAPVPLPLVRTPDLEGHHDGPAPANIMELLFNDSAVDYPEYADEPSDLGLNLAPADDEVSDPSVFNLDPTPTLYRRLDRIRVPRQIVAADHDNIIPDQVIADWSRWLDAPVVTISGHPKPTGHMLLVQQPKEFVDQITAFAKEATP